MATKGTRTGKHPKKHSLHRDRILWVFLGIGLAVIAILLKLLYLQVWDAEELKKKAQRSRNHSLALFNRGRILDRNGVILAQDNVLYDIYAHPRYYWKLKPHQIASALSPVLSIPVDQLTQKLSEPPSTIGVKKNVPKELVETIQQLRIPVPKIDPKTQRQIHGKDGRPLVDQVRISGLDFAKKTVRNYPQGSLAAHVLGYVNDEANISTGVEYTARHILKRRPDDMTQAVLSGRGDVIHVDQMDPKSLVTLPQADDVVLTLDSKLQYIAERELDAGLERTKAKRGAVVMLAPKTGEVLAFAVSPHFTPDQYYKASAEELKNWAITDVYPPGSTFKILTVACGLESGVIHKNSRIEDTGKMKIGGWDIRNYDYYKSGAPGMIDLVYLFQHSSNIASAKIAMMTPKAEHEKLLRRFGLGKRTGIDIPGESSGLFSSSNTWDVSTHATLGYGYGLASTPIQMAAAIAAIANKGVWITPHVLKNQKKITKRQVLSPETAETVTHLLAESIRTAKTSTVRLEGIDIAGKTGTSYKPRSDGKGYDENVYTSFVGYFPAKDPEVLIMVVVDSPKIAEAFGSTVAGPIFKAIADETVSYLNLKPAIMPAKNTSHLSQRTVTTH